MVLKLTSVLAEERDRADRPGLSIFDRAATAVQNTDFDSAQGDFLLFRCLVAHPWPERMAAQGMHSVRLPGLGRIFDLPGVYRRFERPVLDLWCRWSLRWLRKLSSMWLAANGACNLTSLPLWLMQLRFASTRHRRPSEPSV
jgi:hypothetical protein